MLAERRDNDDELPGQKASQKLKEPDQQLVHPLPGRGTRFWRGSGACGGPATTDWDAW